MKLLSPSGQIVTLTEVGHKRYVIADSFGSYIITSLAGWHVIG
jgi:hypothetical protein